MVILIRKNLLIVGLLLVLITSCNFSPFLTNQEPHSEWVTKWFTNPTCQPPCWENITPGQTQIDDVAAIFTNLKEIKNYSNPHKGPFGESRQMDWKFDQSSDSGIIQTDDRGNNISQISIVTYQPLTIEEVISKYGDPTNVLLYDCRSDLGQKRCVVHLVYKNKGMMLEIMLNDIGKNMYQVKIEKNSKLSIIHFFPDTEDSYEKIIGKNSFNYPKYYYSWNGYSNYPEK
jgi:hypothetical protein